MDMPILSENTFVRLVDWNKLEDPLDGILWERMNTNLWVPEKISLSEDIPSWSWLTQEEQWLTICVFQSLNSLDTRQQMDGIKALLRSANTPHEEPVLGLIGYMEGVHAKSYSYMFSTLCQTSVVNKAKEWALSDPHLNRKIELVLKAYYDPDPLKARIASVFLESFLFYSGFYLPLYWASRARLTNTADLIKLIIRDEAMHGYYIGAKFQQHYADLSDERRDELKVYAYELLMELYDNEVKYTENLYDVVGLTGDVKKFLRYNANKALMLLGFDPLFPSDDCNANQAVLAALVSQENHDFFSGSGSTYRVATVEHTIDSDWE